MRPHGIGRRHLGRKVAAGLLFVQMAAGGALIACGSSNDSGGGVASVNNGSGPSASPSVTASADPSEQMLKFTQCLRDHGLEVQDPGADGLPKLNPSTDPQKRQQALDACRPLAPGALASGGLTNDDKNQMLAYIQCLRGQGISIADPDPKTGLPQTQDLNKFRNPDPAMLKAMDVCKDKRPQGLGEH